VSAREELLALAARVEALTGPCRETFLEVFAACYPEPPPMCEPIWRAENPKQPIYHAWKTREMAFRKLIAAEAWLDAAMMLVPEEHVLSLSMTSDDEKRRYTGDALMANWIATLIRQEHCGYKIDFRGHYRYGGAATHAFALTAAALRARADTVPA
jgi:hypothetical protein